MNLIMSLNISDFPIFNFDGNGGCSESYIFVGDLEYCEVSMIILTVLKISAKRQVGARRLVTG